MSRPGTHEALRVDPDRLWSHATTLCVDIGARLSGTPQSARAIEYIAEHFRKCGADVEMQKYPCPSWEHESTELSLLGTGDPRPLPAFAQTFSEACDVEGVLVGVPREEELEFAPDLDGKVLLVHGRLATSLAADRNPRVLSIESRRPAAVIAVSPDETVSTKLLRDPFLRIPAAAVSASVGRELLSNEGARVRLCIRAQRFEATGQNIIARLGNGDDDHLVLASHFDTSAESPGATDNASGTAAVLELCEVFAAAGRNGIHFVTYDAEEYGRHSSLGSNLGSVEYVRRHSDDVARTRGVVEADCIGTVDVPPRSRVMGWSATQRKGISEALDRFSRFVVDARPEDEPPRTALHLPGASVVTFVNDYGKLPIHTAQDTIDLMSADELAYTTDAISAVVDRLSSGSSRSNPT